MKPLLSFFHGVLGQGMCLSQAYNQQGKLLYLNDLCCEKLQYTSEAPPRLSELLSAKEHRRFQEHFQLVCASDVPTEVFPLTFRAKGGRRVSTRGRLGRLSVGGETYVRGDFLDVRSQEKSMHIQKICYSIMDFSIANRPAETLQRSMEALYTEISDEFRQAFQIENFSVIYTRSNALKLTDFVSYSQGSLTQQEKEEEKKLCCTLGEEVLERGESLIVFRKGAEKILASRGLSIQKIPHTWIGSEIRFCEDVKAFVCFSSYSPWVNYDTKDLEIMKYLGQQIALVLEKNLRDDRILCQQASLLSLFESSSHLVWFVNRRGGLTSFNQNFAENAEHYYSFIPKGGLSLGSVSLPWALRKLFWMHYKRAFSGVSTSFECILEREGCEKKWMEIFLNPISNGRGILETEEVSAIAHDITINRRAREVAERSLRAKKVFLANMSHEIRTPVGGIIGMTELLENTTLSSNQRHYVEVVKKSSEILLYILNDILQLSKIEAGKMVLQRKEVSLQMVFDKLHHLFSYQSDKTKVPVDLRMAPNVPGTVVTDETRLLQILSNLVSNAIKFSKGSGKIFVSVYVKAESQEALTLHFKIKDQGIGIAREDIPRLFESFSQLEESTHKRFSGAGLGLIISQKIAESMQGEMGVFSTHHRGSTFWFTIRVGRVTASKEDNTPPPSALYSAQRQVDDVGASGTRCGR